ncbi:Sds3-like-domain-containing protein [Dichotomocladium elegans]|nr:Sds3-like-domain-containing protein [Dichotomocladium elegans]
MYPDQTVLPPQMPRSPSRFTLPSIGSSAPFSTPLPGLSYGNDHREPTALQDRVGRWQLPPLAGLAPPSSTDSNDYHHQRHRHQDQQHQYQYKHQHHVPARSSPPQPVSTSASQIKSAQPLASTSSQTIHRRDEKSSIWRSRQSHPPRAQSPATLSKPPISSTSLYEPQTALTTASQPAVPEDPYYYTPHTDERPAIFSERIQEIDQEFIENRETIYLEKLKRLQEELSAIQHGGHEVFDDYVADMEKERAREFENASILMAYRIQYADKLYKKELWMVEDEAETERRELKKAMLAIIEEKRKRIKEYRDEDTPLSNDFVLSTPQTRNRRRTRGSTNGTGFQLTLDQLMINKNGAKNHTNKRRNNDRSREATNINYALNNRNEDELEADFNAMRQDMSSGNGGPGTDDDYLPDGTDHLPKRQRASYYYEGSNSSSFSRSSRR